MWGNMAKVARLLRCAGSELRKAGVGGDDDPKPDGQEPWPPLRRKAVGAESGVVWAFPRVRARKVAAWTARKIDWE